MDKIIEDIIEIEAKVFANFHNIANVKRVFSIMKKTAIDSNGFRFDKKREGDPLQYGLKFRPSLDEAVAFLPPNKALELFENCELDKLIVKTGVVEFLTNKETPFYTYAELAQLFKEFIRYLNYNKDSLLSIGYPSKSFESSHWLYRNLSRLCPVKLPDSIQGRRSYSHQRVAEEDNIAEKDSEGNLIFKYTWVKEIIKPLVPFDKQTFCTYEEAPFIDGLYEKDIGFIEEQRMKLLNLKIRILELAYTHIYDLSLDKNMSKNNHDTFWNNCITAISEKLSLQDFKLFNKIEETYSDLFLLKNFANDHYLLTENPVSGVSKDLAAGAITNILEFVNFVEQELRFGNLNNIKTKLLSLTNNQIPTSYYLLTLFPRIAEIDKAIFGFLSNDSDSLEFNELFNKRLASDIEKKFKMFLPITPHYYEPIKAYAHFIEASHNIGIDVTTHLLSSMLIEQKIRLKSVKIKYVDKEIAIEIGNRKCVMPPNKNEHYFCRAMYKPEVKVNEPIDWDIIYKEITACDANSRPEENKKKERTVYDAMESLNNRIKKDINTDDDLFSWQEKTVKRNY